MRRCDAPYPGEAIRANYVSYIYGDDCPPGPDEGCAPELEIQSWPACERTLSDYTYNGGPYPQASLGQLRGVPAVMFDYGERIELYSGSTTIVIFGRDPELTYSAVDAVRVEPANLAPGVPLTLVQRRAANLPLPTANLTDPVDGAMTGDLVCSA
jgi:hypothetical protein